MIRLPKPTLFARFTRK